MDHWESLIAERMRPCQKVAVEDYEHTEGRKRQHRTWASSAFGKFSMQMRGKRYRSTEKGKANSRKKSNAYYARHKDDPEFRARKQAQRDAWKERNPERAKELRDHCNAVRAGKKNQRRLGGEHVLALLGITLKVRMVA